MRERVLLALLVLVFQYVTGQNTIGSVICNANHTVNINISDVEHLDTWNETQWAIQQKTECQPTFSGSDVIFSDLVLPDCSLTAEQLSGSIRYTIEIKAEQVAPGDTGQLRVYDHLYLVFCDYDNEDRATASFVPVKNRAANDSSGGNFTFTLKVYNDLAHTIDVPNPVALDQTLYFEVMVETQSAAPNLDLFLEKCWSSKSNDAQSMDGKFELIVDGCGNSATSKDASDTLSYSCKDDDKAENFTIQSYRYYGAEKGDEVFIHCDLRVCLADSGNSACECPTDSLCPNSRKKRSVVDESEVYRVTFGPLKFESEEQEENGSDHLDEDHLDGEKSFTTTVAIIAVVSGIVSIAVVSVTIFLIMRNRNKWRQHKEPSIVT